MTESKSVALLKKAHMEHQAERLFEAKVSLLEHGVYPTDVFLKEHTEAVLFAEQVEQLETLAEQHKTSVPTLYILVKRTSDVLLEGKDNTKSMEKALLTYACISEGLRGCVLPAIKRMVDTGKVNPSTSLASGYGKTDAGKLLEFCLLRAKSTTLLENDFSPVCKQLGEQLSELSLNDVVALCEGVPQIKTYVPSATHTAIAKQLLELS